MPDLICSSGHIITDMPGGRELSGDFDMPEVHRQVGRLSSYYMSAGELDILKELIQWLDDERARNHVTARREGLNDLNEWHFDPSGSFSHRQEKFFRVIGLKVLSGCREVTAWCQPILDNYSQGIVGLLSRRVNGVTQFLMQAKADVGNRNIVQLGPTVQFNPGNYIDNEKLKKPFLFDEFLEGNAFLPAMESMQAEEGGRFYMEENRHRILMLPDGMELDLPPQYRWLSYGHIRFFLHMGDIVNSSARSILACLI